MDYAIFYHGRRGRLEHRAPRIQFVAYTVRHCLHYDQSSYKYIPAYCRGLVPSSSVSQPLLQYRAHTHAIFHGLGLVVEYGTGCRVKLKANLMSSLHLRASRKQPHRGAITDWHRLCVAVLVFHILWLSTCTLWSSLWATRRGHDPYVRHERQSRLCRLLPACQGWPS